MARSRFGQGARLASLALATGTLVVASVGTAGASVVKAPSVYGGNATGSALHLEIHLPVPVTVPGIGDLTDLEQDISFVNGNTAADTVNKPIATAKAVLGNGNIVALQGLLNKTSDASLSGSKRDDSQAIVQQQIGPINLGLGTIASKVSPEAAGTTLTSRAASELAHLSINLGTLNLPVGLKTDLNGALQNLASTVSSTASGAAGTVTTTLNGVLNQLDQASQGATAPVSSQIKGVEQQVTTLLQNLQSALPSLDASSNLVSLDTLQSTNEVTRKGAAVSADAMSLIKNLDVLGTGDKALVHLDIAKTESSAVATGVKGGAAAHATPYLLNLRVGDVLKLQLGPNGLTGSLGGQTLPAAAQDAVNTVLSTVNGLLKTAGVDIQEGKATSAAAADGSSASASAQGFAISVNPLKAAKPLVLIQLVPTAASVAATVIPNVPVCTSPPCGPVPPPVPPHHAKNVPLAHTGLELPVTGAIATALLLGGFAARRRMGSSSI